MYIRAFIHFMVSNITVNHWLINSANFLLCQNKWTSCSDVHHFQLNVTELVIVYICIMLHLWRRRCEFLEIPSLSLPVTWNQSNDASHCTYWALKSRRYRWFELTFIHTWCLHTHTRTLRISWETPASSWKWHLGRSVIPLYCNHTDVSSFITAPSAKRAERLLAPVCGIPPLQTAHTHTARAVLKSSFAPLSSKIQICFKMTEHKIKPVLFLRISELVSVFSFQLFLVFCL